MRSPSQLKDDRQLAILRLFGAGEEIRQKIAEASKLEDNIKELDKQIKESEMR